MKQRIIFAAAVSVVLYFCYTPATTLDGGTGMIRVPYASTLGKSKLLVNGQTNATMQKGKIYDGYYYAAMNQVGAIYGMNQFWDVWLTIRGYEDDVTKKEEAWGNAKIGTKYNYYNNRKLRLNLSGELLIILPTGRYENVQWQPFHSGNLEFQLSAIASYYKYYHGVASYIFHNDSGTAFTSVIGGAYDKYGEKSTHELAVGLGGEYPIIRDILLASGELTGRFILGTKQNIRSSEPWIQFTAGAKYFLTDNLYFSGGIDLRLYGKDNDITTHNPGPGMVFYKDCDNYPLWRIGLDANWLAYQKYKIVRRKDKGQGEMAEEEKDSDEAYLDLISDFGSVEVSQELQEKMKLYKQLKLQQRETKEAEKELEEIKLKRKEAEKELQKLRNMLEEID